MIYWSDIEEHPRTWLEASPVQSKENNLCIDILFRLDINRYPDQFDRKSPHVTPKPSMLAIESMLPALMAFFIAHRAYR